MPLLLSLLRILYVRHGFCSLIEEVLYLLIEEMFLWLECCCTRVVRLPACSSVAKVEFLALLFTFPPCIPDSLQINFMIFSSAILTHRLSHIPRIARRFSVNFNIEKRVLGLHFIGSSLPDISGYLLISYFFFQFKSDLTLTRIKAI